MVYRESPPKLGGVPSEARRGGSHKNLPVFAHFFLDFALSGSRFAVREASPPNLGEEFVIHEFHQLLDTVGHFIIRQAFHEQPSIRLRAEPVVEHGQNSAIRC